MPPAIVVERHGEVDIVEFATAGAPGQLATTDIARELEQLIDGLDAPQIVLNLANLHYVASATLGVIMTAHRKIKSKNGELRLAGLTAPVLHVFQHTKLDGVLKICNTVKDAIRDFRPDG